MKPCNLHRLAGARLQEGDLVLEARDQFGLGENVAFDRAFYIRDFGFRFQPGLVIQRVQLEKIVMGRSGRRARAAVTNLAVIVLALTRAVKKFRLRGDALGQRTRCGRQVVQQPVNHRFLRRVRIIHDQCEALCAGGRLGPCQRGRNIRTIASVLRGNGAVGDNG